MHRSISKDFSVRRCRGPTVRTGRPWVCTWHMRCNRAVARLEKERDCLRRLWALLGWSLSWVAWVLHPVGPPGLDRYIYIYIYLSISVSVSVSVSISIIIYLSIYLLYLYIYIYIHTHTLYIYVYIYICSAI